MTSYPKISRHLMYQLSLVPESRDAQMVFRPCAVTLKDGTDLPCVYVVDAKMYIRYWLVYPEDRPGRRSVSIRDVRFIRDSPNRLPAVLADALYQAGESGMGYTIFTVKFNDGRQQSYLAGGALDFIEAPAGLRAADAVAVEPHLGREQAEESIDYYWCLYDGVEGDCCLIKGVIERINRLLSASANVWWKA